MNRKKSNGKVVITRKSIKGESSQAAKVARFDMQKEGTKLLSEDQVFTQEELDDLYSYDKNEPWWNR